MTVARSLGLLLVAVSSLLVVACGDDARRNAINAIVGSAGEFQLPPDQALAPVGQALTSTATDPNTGTTFQCTQQEYSASENADTLAVVNPNADVLWPGSVLQGASLVSGDLNPVPAKRAPGTVTLTLAASTPDKSSGGFSADLKEPNLSSVTNAINAILTGYAAGNGTTPAKFTYDSEVVYSLNQLDFLLKAGANWSNMDVNGTLSFDTSARYNRVMMRLSQEYYTMAFDPPYSASDFFYKDVTAAALKPYTAPGNPMVYISSVTYGRLFVFLFESTADVTTLKAAVDAAFKLSMADVGGTMNTGLANVLTNSVVKVFALGGNAADAAAAAASVNPNTGDVSGLATFLKQGANFGPQQPGVPLSYTTRYLKDSTSVRVNLTTDYVENQCVPVLSNEDIQVSANSLTVSQTCGSNSWWSTPSAKVYWNWQADVLDPAGTTLQTVAWSTRSSSNALAVSNGTTVSLTDSAVIHGVPLQKGVCVRVYGNLDATGSSPTLLGSYSDLHCYNGNAWAPIGQQTTSMDPPSCSSTDHNQVNYSFTPL